MLRGACRRINACRLRVRQAGNISIVRRLQDPAHRNCRSPSLALDRIR